MTHLKLVIKTTVALTMWSGAATAHTAMADDLIDKLRPATVQLAQPQYSTPVTAAEGEICEQPASQTVQPPHTKGEALLVALACLSE